MERASELPDGGRRAGAAPRRRAVATGRPTPGHRGGRALAASHPAVALEWDRERNDRAADEVSAGSNLVVSWRCARGHEWRAAIYSRALKGSGCPVCARTGSLRHVGPLATTHPGVAAEWHPGRNGDLEPRSVSAGSARRAWWRCARGHEWQAAVANRTGKGTGCPHCARHAVAAGADLATTHPDLAAEWHPEHNGDLGPASVSATSRRRVWWRCREGHEWLARIDRRAADSTTCPICDWRWMMLRALGARRDA